LLQHGVAIAATEAPTGSVSSRDKGRNRDERRTVSVFSPADWLANTGWQDQVAAIIRVQREVYSRNTATGLLDSSCETAFYAANIALSAERAAEAIRGHWRIENTSHYSRDVTFGQDRSRIRTNPSVFARLRSFAFNILLTYKTATRPQDRYRAALVGVDRLLKMIIVTER
jgi:predicted transposase YbfD/YdcC